MAGLRPGFFTLGGRLFVILTDIIKADRFLANRDGANKLNIQHLAQNITFTHELPENTLPNVKIVLAQYRA